LFLKALNAPDEFIHEMVFEPVEFFRRALLKKTATAPRLFAQPTAFLPKESKESKGRVKAETFSALPGS